MAAVRLIGSFVYIFGMAGSRLGGQGGLGPPRGRPRLCTRFIATSEIRETRFPEIPKSATGVTEFDHSGPESSNSVTPIAIFELPTARFWPGPGGP